MALTNKIIGGIEEIAKNSVAKATEKGTTSKIGEAVLGATDKISKAGEKKAEKKIINEAIAAAANKNHAAESALVFLNASDDVIDKAVKQGTDDVIDKAVKQGTKEMTQKKVSSGIGKTALIGSGVGAVGGAGIGGITGMATGADEDDMKAMVVTGAIAGAAGGAFVGGGMRMGANKKATGSFLGAVGADDLKTAGNMAGGKANEAVNGGAKGFLDKVGASVQSFNDRGIAGSLDDFGSSVKRKYQNKQFQGVASEWEDNMLAKGYSKADLLDDGTFMGNAFQMDLNSKIMEASEGIATRGNVLGGMAQGALIGSASGAVVGGVMGGIDEDETFIGGALKGGITGGLLGGAGGAASGYFNNSARLLNNTTNNLASIKNKFS